MESKAVFFSVAHVKVRLKSEVRTSWKLTKNTQMNSTYPLMV